MYSSDILSLIAPALAWLWVIVVIRIVLCFLVGNKANREGRSFWLWFLISAFALGPLWTYLLLRLLIEECGLKKKMTDEMGLSPSEKYYAQCAK
ncbi:hypothetical protein [Porphyromonas levii]|uniref:hypothetical protein n=1 Tax=Porphyromonas levii TaxID=28114 RepID=UPI000372A1EF|nr:hypothetical protein [Porphyromonas levii]MBR8712246.1 hypothetical protein [Porphyromonas levii]MBR8714288.1 hypothetical protein [Porphyromonas levii]MBR8726829.1 hypothetical protein [Porphyromonas levii]MBR8735136.1 hypothetical protein [Porphyromonas levii]MBR8777237.1 hypothetical protein [Porphyromonas levii]